MIRDFGPESRNPRARRAYAHAMIGKVATGQTNPDTVAMAIEVADKTEKGRRSGFARALINATHKGSSELYRRSRAVELGLPEDSSYADINAHTILVTN